jgi:hypothetical protein
VDALFCKLEPDEKKVTNLPPVANEHRKAENSHLPGIFFQFCDVATLAIIHKKISPTRVFFPNFVM